MPLRPCRKSLIQCVMEAMHGPALFRSRDSSSRNRTTITLLRCWPAEDGCGKKKGSPLRDSPEKQVEGLLVVLAS